MKFTVDDEGDLKATFSDTDAILFILFNDENGKRISDPLASTVIDQLRVMVGIPGDKFTASQRREPAEKFNGKFIYKLVEAEQGVMVLSLYAVEHTKANDSYVKAIAETLVKNAVIYTAKLVP